MGGSVIAAIALSALDIAVLIVYLAFIAGMGVYFARRRRVSGDYFLAGQKIPWWAAGLSLLGTSLSAITFMAIPAKAFQTDWVYLLGNLMIVAVAPAVIWCYLPFYRRLKVTSAYEYLELRFGLATRLVGSATFLLFQLGRMGIVVYLPALALSAVSGWNIYACIVAIGLLATFYTTLGGIEAVIWTDVVQVVVLLGGVAVSFVVILMKVPGGAAEIYSTGLAAGKLHAMNLTWDVATASLWVVVLGNFFKFLIPYSSDQAVIQRYLTTSNERDAARGIWLNALASAPVWAAFFALGTCLWAFYQAFPERLNATGHPDQIFAWFIVNELPHGLAGLLVAALFAASMSSLDSSINSMSTALTTDFYGRLRKDSSDADRLRIARIATVVFGIVGTLTAIWLAWLGTKSIWDQFLKIMGLFGGGLAGMFVAGIFTRRAHQKGVLIGFAVSAAILYWASATGAVHFFLYGGIGILTCSIVGWLASLALTHPSKSLDGLTIHSLK
ncbi:MAG: sodium:solute symporter [Verrucomicrobiales bacterium]|nr:sodium:solute symporter [Verrucomicrobiales bacterium]